jgi:hypothetical protein
VHFRLESRLIGGGGNASNNVYVNGVLAANETLERRPVAEIMPQPAFMRCLIGIQRTAQANSDLAVRVHYDNIEGRRL